MQRVPDAAPESFVDELLRWIAFERDAAWTAKKTGEARAE
jgi:hypothetical protein